MSRCAESKRKMIKLNSPAGGKPKLMSFKVPFNNAVSAVRSSNSDTDSECDDVDNFIKTIEFIGKDNAAIPINDILVDKQILHTSFNHIVNVCNKYNRCINAIRFLEDGTSLPQQRINRYPSRELTNFVIEGCYKRAVKHPQKLNKYDPFSPEVYGETSFELLCLIIDSLQITEDDVFLDLGSGVGQVVLQMAALTPCKLSIGIEKNVIPSSYATNLSAYFNSWMVFFGKKVGNIELHKNDFLAEECLPLIRKATIIFVNNISFGPQINHELTLRFQDLNDGVRIISPVTFCPEKFRITGRSLGNIASIMSIVEIPNLKGPVSWTSKSVAYYIHIIDRTKLENFFVQCVRKHRSEPIETESHQWKKTYDSEPTKFRSVFTEPPSDASSASSTMSGDDGETTISKSFSNETTLTASSSQTSLCEPRTMEPKCDEVAQKLDQLLSTFAKQFEDMLRTMKQDSYKDFITQQIEEERARNHQLKQTLAFLERRVQVLDQQNLELTQNMNFANLKNQL